MNLNIQQMAFVARAMYTTGKRGNMVCYLMLLQQKKDLSVDEFAVYMDGVRSPSTGQPLTRKQVYSTLYSMDKTGYVRKEKMISEEGAVCNVYYITEEGKKIVEDFQRMLENIDTVEPMITASLFSNAKFQTRLPMQTDTTH